MTTKQLEKAWSELSPIQKEAAEWATGPVLVLAGPGSGKTRVLTCRIAKLLQATQDQNFRILGLTFTTKAADEMRTRVLTFCPGQEDRLFLGTFHSFCADILRQHGTHVGIQPNFSIYSQDADLNAVLSDAVEEAMHSYDIITDLDKKTLPVIQRLKSMLVLPGKSIGMFKDAQMDERMSIVYPAYEKELNKRNALDFNSLIMKAYELFSKYAALAKRYRSVFPYICIDEFQDTNIAQYSLIRALTQDQHKNVFVVADDDQIIYQWNGASFKRIEDLRRDYAPKVIQLPDNYRCPPEIVDIANNLIPFNSIRTPDKKPLRAIRMSGGADAVRVLQFEDFEAETAGIAEDIKGLHSKELGSVVILARSRKLLEAAEQALREEGIAAIISQRKDAFESAPFVWLHSMMCLGNDRQNRHHLELVCGSFSKLSGTEVDPEDVISEANASNRDYLQHWIKLIRRRKMDEPAARMIDLASRHLAEGRDFLAFESAAQEWCSKLGSKASGDSDDEVFFRYDEERAVWRELMADIKRSLGDEITLEALLQELQMRSKEPAPKPNTVVLMTIHGAKGKEFPYVYLIGMVDDELPSFQSKKRGDDSPEMEEERRNCFVAITRTIKSLTLSFSDKYRGWPKKPSRFLVEMGLVEA
jgi:DNA helicase II / ATP-dependent DNA helicase PcrA